MICSKAAMRSANRTEALTHAHTTIHIVTFTLLSLNVNGKALVCAKIN